MRNLNRHHAVFGQGTLEFAIVSLLLMTMFLGVLDLGRAVFQRQDLANASREAARFASLTPSSRSKSATAFATDVAITTNQYSASLALTATNFTANGGSITCDTWSVSSVPTHGPVLLNLVGLGGGFVAMKPPSGTSGGTGSWSNVACGSAQPGDRITVCISYTFQPVAARLLQLGSIVMDDCSSVLVQ